MFDVPDVFLAINLANVLKIYTYIHQEIALGENYSSQYALSESGGAFTFIAEE